MSKLDLSSVTAVIFENADQGKAQELIKAMTAIADFGGVIFRNKNKTLQEFQRDEFTVGAECKTSHLMTMHLDGFILNPEQWNPAWLKYDYIGAPWPKFHLCRGMHPDWIYRVGNSGFSMRSVKLNNRAMELNQQYRTAFDLLACQVARQQLMAEGYQFASTTEAAKFSTELLCEATVENPFGFHGVWPKQSSPPSYYKIGHSAKHTRDRLASKPTARVILLTADGPQSPRTEFARSTHTGAEYHIVKCMRTASDMGDEKGCYYVNDIFDLSLQLSGDVFCYVNNDVALVPEWKDVLLPAVKEFGCAFSQRMDVPKFDKPLTLADLPGKPSYIGTDVFAFTPQWWRETRDNFPLLPLGYEGWDAVMTYLMCQSGFKRGPMICYHESHGVAWWNQTHRDRHPAILANRQRQVTWAINNNLRHLLDAPNGYLWKEGIFCL